MTNLISIDYVLPLILAGLLIYAALSDLLRFIIPNWLNLTILAFGIIYQIIYGDIVLALGAGAIVLTIGFVLFAIRALGGGDVKLLAATAVWVGMAELPIFLVHTTIAGGVLSVLWLMSGRVRQILVYYGVDIDVAVPKFIPYGIAIAIAGLLMVSRLIGDVAVLEG